MRNIVHFCCTYRNNNCMFLIVVPNQGQQYKYCYPWLVLKCCGFCWTLVLTYTFAQYSWNTSMFFNLSDFIKSYKLGSMKTKGDSALLGCTKSVLVDWSRQNSTLAIYLTNTRQVIMSSQADFLLCFHINSHKNIAHAFVRQTYF